MTAKRAEKPTRMFCLWKDGGPYSPEFSFNRDELRRFLKERIGTWGKHSLFYGCTVEAVDVQRVVPRTGKTKGSK